jgi:hypothetical protein
MTTLKKLAQDAMMIQDACNGSGVAQGFARAMLALGEHTNGTAERNRHPVVQLWIAKLADLAGMEYTWPADAWVECERLERECA